MYFPAMYSRTECSKYVLICICFFFNFVKSLYPTGNASILTWRTAEMLTAEHVISLLQQKEMLNYEII